MFQIVGNQTVPKNPIYLNILPSCFAFLEQDEPVREEHPDVPDRCEPNCSQTSIYLNCLQNCSFLLEQDEHFLICSPFPEQDEPVREEHPDVPDRGEPNCSQTSIYINFYPIVPLF
jgi:hypothetical protein